MASEKQNSISVKVGSVSLLLYPWLYPSGKKYWRFAWHDEHGKRRYTTRSSLKAAKEAAWDRARSHHNRTLDLSSLTQEQANLCRAFLELEPDWNLLQKMKALKGRPDISVSEGVQSFLELKEANAGASPHNVNILRTRCRAFVEEYGTQLMRSITAAKIDSWLAASTWAPRTRRNVRGSLVTLFRWARDQGFVDDSKTAAEKSAVPIVMRSVPLTLQPEELKLMLSAARDEYLPWLALSALAALRLKELYPAPRSRKEALQWEHVDLERRLIIIPPEVSKTNERRITPICERLFRLLQPLAKQQGRITGKRRPADNNMRNPEDRSETARLGSLIGGWRKNALRHSAISYRCALVGISQAAMEAGNSETETKKSYLDAKPKAEALLWFGAEPF